MYILLRYEKRWLGYGFSYLNSNSLAVNKIKKSAQKQHSNFCST